jgi:hypothetical protein
MLLPHPERDHGVRALVDDDRDFEFTDPDLHLRVADVIVPRAPGPPEGLIDGVP